MEELQEIAGSAPSFVSKEFDGLQREADLVARDAGLSEKGRARRFDQILSQARITASLAKASEQLIFQLRDSGFDVSSVEELPKYSDRLLSVLPQLLEAFEEAKDPVLVRALASVLGQEWAGSSTSRSLFDKVCSIDVDSDPGFDSVRASAADAFEKRVRDEVVDDDLLDQLIKFAADKSQGTARNFIVMSLGKIRSRGSRVIPLLLDFLQDDTTYLAAAEALGSLEVVEALPQISRLVEENGSAEKSWERKRLRRIEVGLRRLERQEHGS
jgi:hypothetical protein